MGYTIRLGEIGEIEGWAVEKYIIESLGYFASKTWFHLKIPVSKNIEELLEGLLRKEGEGSGRNIMDSLLCFYQLPIHLDYRILKEEPSIFGQRIVFQLYIISLQADFNDELFMRTPARKNGPALKLGSESLPF